MEINKFKESIKAWSDDELSRQLDNHMDDVDTCWNNAEDSYGEEKYHWYDEMNEAEQYADAIKEEIVSRNK